MIIPVKFHPSRTEGAGGDRGDRLVGRIKPPFLIVLNSTFIKNKTAFYLILNFLI